MAKEVLGNEKCACMDTSWDLPHRSDLKKRGRETRSFDKSNRRQVALSNHLNGVLALVKDGGG
jgi:hypothetical protein